MKRLLCSLVFLAVVNQISRCSAARQLSLQFANDPNYPQLITVSDVSYNLVWSRYLEISATVTAYEDIDDGTSVSQINLNLMIGMIQRTINSISIYFFSFFRSK